MLNVLLIGDIISRPGREALKNFLHPLKQELNIDLCIGNVENAAGMFGITQKIAEKISSYGVDIMTSGNHIWDKKEGVNLLDKAENILRPANYPERLEGRGYLIKKVDSTEVCVINIQGRTFMKPIDCPFKCVDNILNGLNADVRVILVDFHAEATSEKLAMAFYLDGRVSAVVGTHTHVQTSDERILDGGTAYITDLGMTGPFKSVIGVKPEQVIKRFLTQTNVRFKTASSEPCLEGLMVSVDEGSGKTAEIKRISKKSKDE
jgi:metallophosphoesterase (TIGR00282 family)